ncbi:GNAT family N-acetyltransferase [Pseudooctadecabacter jejudonensis]|uniref:L-ornithine N(alpha)-acyltransferase n=1 Tax=Pseudooctadecabacter jejudonensis TaxID=1391910 RepID=A0A1Y5RJ08_9RHOB|nr:GNAT family N-acetyltransferase [Pseudooctadecabacter jejudonensis]SLN18726.1 hypothetical protein PSJ8397_00623 [Pseudooctadecabacter jejudonensis]
MAARATAVSGQLNGAQPVAPLARGGYVARLATGVADVEAAQRLRHLCFFEAAGLPVEHGGLDRDAFDPLCDHVLVEDAQGRLVAACRVQVHADAAAAQAGYTGASYDLTGLEGVLGPFLELGRFCIAPNVFDPDVMRLAWGMLARIVDAHMVTFLFGCSSFAGTDALAYRPCFNLLAARHVRCDVGVGAAEVVRFAEAAGPLPDTVQDRRAALSMVPPLLRTYLSMGGWVSDHAVVDRAMRTLHVFTGVSIADIPPARAAALRSVATDA